MPEAKAGFCRYVTYVFGASVFMLQLQRKYSARLRAEAMQESIGNDWWTREAMQLHITITYILHYTSVRPKFHYHWKDKLW